MLAYIALIIKMQGCTMQKILLLSALFTACLMAVDAPANMANGSVVMQKPVKEVTPSVYNTIRLSVVGQGVAPTMTSSPAQAYALAKRAAIADAYRLLAEKVKGVKIEGQDKIKNMMVQRSEVLTFVNAVIAEAEIIETVFKDGLCEVEMELVVDPKQWRSILASR